MSERIGAAIRSAVIARAQNRCEYCGMPDTETLIGHEPDHVVATQHGGMATLENLAYACFLCNRFKGPNIASLDPVSGALTPLFNPRLDQWASHFRLTAGHIDARTAIGRATAFLLRLNDPDRVTARAHLLRQGRYPRP